MCGDTVNRLPNYFIQPLTDAGNFGVGAFFRGAQLPVSDATQLFGTANGILGGRDTSAPFGNSQHGYAAITGRSAFPDAAVDGLELRVSASGRKSWALRYVRKSDNAHRRVTLGRFPDVSLDKARLKAAKMRVEIAEGDDPAGGVAARKVAITFAQVADEWIERHAILNKSERSVDDNRSMLKRDILPVIGAMKAAEVAKRDVIKLLDTVATRGDLRATVTPSERRLTTRPNRVYELIRAICRWAVGRDILQYDPTWGMRAPVKRGRPRDRGLSPTEIAAFWSALDRTPLAAVTCRPVGRAQRNC